MKNSAEGPRQSNLPVELENRIRDTAREILTAQGLALWPTRSTLPSPTFTQLDNPGHESLLLQWSGASGTTIDEVDELAVRGGQIGSSLGAVDATRVAASAVVDVKDLLVRAKSTPPSERFATPKAQKIAKFAGAGLAVTAGVAVMLLTGGMSLSGCGLGILIALRAQKITALLSTHLLPHLLPANGILRRARSERRMTDNPLTTLDDLAAEADRPPVLDGGFSPYGGSGIAHPQVQEAFIKSYALAYKAKLKEAVLPSVGILRAAENGNGMTEVALVNAFDECSQRSSAEISRASTLRANALDQMHSFRNDVSDAGQTAKQRLPQLNSTLVEAAREARCEVLVDWAVKAGRELSHEPISAAQREAIARDAERTIAAEPSQLGPLKRQDTPETPSAAVTNWPGL